MWVIPLLLGVWWLIYGWGWARTRRERERPPRILLADGLAGFGFILYALIDLYDFWPAVEISYLLLVIAMIIYFTTDRRD